MGGDEFENRQMWLDFKDAVGPALEALASVVMERRKAFKAWLKAFRMPAPVELPSLLQMPLPLFVAWFPLAKAAAAA
ncbi:MAG: hypothetical protein BGO62_15515 [Thiobacillus sp. 65-1402]|nr:MAG: hypothetical protein BGO62_15515 [Thiobacillus sp. 65-1402]